MARHVRSTALETRTNRLKLPISKKAYSVPLTPGIQLLCRRNAGPCSWSWKRGDKVKRFAIADDFEESNHDSVLTYWEASERALQLARAGEGIGGPVNVFGSLDAYKIDLKANGKNPYNADMVRTHLTEALGNKEVSELTDSDLRDWRNNLIVNGMKPATADRISRPFKAALALTARSKKLTNDSAWIEGLKKLPPSEHSVRDVIQPDHIVAALVRESYKEGHDVGLLIDTLAESGARESQVLRLTVGHLQADFPTGPRLMMPPSKKGKSKKPREDQQLPISKRLAALLTAKAKGKAADAPLLDPVAGLAARFAPVVKRLGLSAKHTPYCLRHSSIARMLLRNVPIRIVAAHHDTSVYQIETVYSHFIIPHADKLTRATLLDIDATAQVIQLPLAS